MTYQTQTHPLFDQIAAREQAEIGIAAAAENNATLLVFAKRVAVEIASSRPDRCISADDVQERLMVLGYREGVLGNAAGSLFRGREWTFDHWTTSRRIKSHARGLRVWRYVGK